MIEADARTLAAMLEEFEVNADKKEDVAPAVGGIALVSAAISLKRIADAMTTGTKNDRVPATTVAQAFGYKPGMANHDLLIAHIERMAEHGFMVVES